MSLQNIPEDILNAIMNGTEIPDSPFANYILHPALDTLDNILYIGGLCVTPLNLFFTVFAFYVSIRDFKRLHRNFV